MLNKTGPLIRKLSRDGRFFVTFDEFTASGTSPVTVVIYDLARKEHTAYAGKDFLSDKLIKSLPDHSFIRGFRWFGKDFEFNRDSTQFYPTRPENSEEEGVPFVVIDLPTRTVSVQPISTVDQRDIVPNVPQKWGWTESRETVATDTTFLPVRMTWSSPDEPDRVLELAPNKEEYVTLKDKNRGQQK